MMPGRTCVALLVLVLGSACTDLVTVDVGRDRVPPITFERELLLGGGGRFGCPEMRAFAPGALAGSASVTRVPSGCLVRARLDDARMVDAEKIGKIADSIEELDRTALVGIDVAIDELTLEGDGAALASDSVRDLTILLEGETVLSAADPRSVEGERVALPEPVVDAFFEAVDARRDLRIGVEVRLTFRERAPVPDRLRVRMVLQPILRVDLVRAAL